MFRSASAMVIALLILSLILITSPASLAKSNCSGSPGKRGAAGKECRTCIVNQLKFGCPKCVPLLRCMARCLWNGTARNTCGKRCDRNGGKPSLGECKTCMSKCKCSCVA